MKKAILGLLAYMVPTFPLGYLWHLTVFADYYQSLRVYRDDIIIPLGILSMVVQGVIWSVIYARMFAGEPILRGALKFGLLACPLGWSYMVIAVSAKHQMSFVAGFVAIESCFMLAHYAIVSPLIAAVYRCKSGAEK